LERALRGKEELALLAGQFDQCQKQIRGRWGAVRLPPVQVILRPFEAVRTLLSPVGKAPLAMILYDSCSALAEGLGTPIIFGLDTGVTFGVRAVALCLDAKKVPLQRMPS
jgi:hypothetical protein